MIIYYISNEYCDSIKSGGGTGSMKPDNRHSHKNASVLIPAASAER